MNWGHSRLLWFLLLPPPALVLFFWWALRSRQKLLTRFIEARLLTSLTVGISTTRKKWQFFLVILAIELLIIAMAGPQHGYDLQEVEQRGLDIVMAVDTSKSMLATDIAPSRLERAKLAVLDLMQKAAGDRWGLVAFAGDGFLECPLTTDNTMFEQSTRELSVNSIPRGGSALAAAIDTALAAFKEQDHYKALVLFTDGEDNDEGALQAAQAAAKAGLKIFTVGIGSAEGTLVQVTDANGNTDYIRDEKGQVLKSKLNEALLQQIATVTGGFYLPLRGANTIDTLYDRGLASMPKSEGKLQTLRQYHEKFWWVLVPAILLLLLEIFLPERTRERKARRPTGNKSPVSGKLTAVLVALALLGFSTRTMASPQSAWNDYHSGNYTNALAEYERLADISTNDLRLVFNAGTAAYRATNYDAAAKLFAQATLSPDLKMQQRAYYNLGNTKFRMSDATTDLDKLQESWEAVTNIYAKAVDLDKQDADAAHNLDFVMRGVEQLKMFREAMRRAKSDADAAVREANYHRALEIMEELAKYQIASKKFEDYTKKLKDIDAIATPHQP